MIRVLEGKTTVDELLRKRAPSAAFARKQPRVATRVSFDNKASQHFSVIDVRAEDRLGLLYAVASAVHREGIEIAIAVITTEANRGLDSFYVSRAGQKIPDAECDAIASRIGASIDAFVGA